MPQFDISGIAGGKKHPHVRTCLLHGSDNIPAAHAAGNDKIGEAQVDRGPGRQRILGLGAADCLDHTVSEVRDSDSQEPFEFRRDVRQWTSVEVQASG